MYSSRYAASTLADRPNGVVRSVFIARRPAGVSKPESDPTSPAGRCFVAHPALVALRRSTPPSDPRATVRLLTLSTQSLRRGVVASLVVTAAALLVASSALATRHPFPSEQTAITAVVLRDIRATKGLQKTCTLVSVQISQFGRDYAEATPYPRHTPVCRGAVGSGFELLHRRGVNSWTVIYRGSLPPSCEKPPLPAAVFEDFFDGRESSCP